jgi:hypothetical protein
MIGLIVVIVQPLCQFNNSLSLNRLSLHYPVQVFISVHSLGGNAGLLFGEMMISLSCPLNDPHMSLRVTPLIILLTFFNSFLMQAQQHAVDSNFHVYLLIGQSNMAGRGPLDAESKQVNPRILMLDSLKQWVAATDPVHFDKPSMVGVGPAIGFAQEMLQHSKSNIKIGLIPCAWGGSPIKAWEPGAAYLTGHPYDDAIARTRVALQQGVLKGILWHQGESDNDTAHAAVYLDKLTQLIERLRTELQQPGVPFVAGEIGHFNKKTLINEVINQLPQHVRGTAVVSAKDLTDKGDQLHFDTKSARELGKRYARALQPLQRK